MSAWRQVGLNYINYSNVAAKVLRKSLKPEFRADALKRDISHVKITPWANGRPAHVIDIRIALFRISMSKVAVVTSTRNMKIFKLEPKSKALCQHA